ncbi:membrane protein insertion efficiency factor YidD [Mobilicoccus massiliensis]|uniref:membrane protein insertion efficiency factor YidD n=1 Tax=Mobilicoccus massiliensis TaxID=1522310 RepID=UPI000BB32DE6|nr:membrane protein insertion efficiency factor YidD [Mobilicoccus massiliensis]
MPFLAAVRVYQICLSPLLPQSCRFHPSCSAYTFTAIERFGPIRGVWLGACRLARCHPWNPGGVDYVPERGEDGRPVRQNDRGPLTGHDRPRPETATEDLSD